MIKRFDKLIRRKSELDCYSLRSRYQLSGNELRKIDNLIKEDWVKFGYSRKVGVWLLGCSAFLLSTIISSRYLKGYKLRLMSIDKDSNSDFPRTSEAWENKYKSLKKHPQFKLQLRFMELGEFKFVYCAELFHLYSLKVFAIMFGAPSVYFAINKVIKFPFLIRILGFSLASLYQLGEMIIPSIQTVEQREVIRKGAKNLLYDKLKNTYPLLSFGYLFYLSNCLLLQHPATMLAFNEYKSFKKCRQASLTVLSLCAINLIYVELAAIHKSGAVCSTFPKMDKYWYPTRKHFKNHLYFEFYNDMFENRFIAQFNHRVLATFTLALTVINFYKILSMGVANKSLARIYLTLLLLTIAQYCSGIVNAVSKSREPFKFGHFSFSLLTFAVSIFSAARSRRILKKQLEIVLKQLQYKDKQRLITELKQLEQSSPLIFEKTFKQAIINQKLV